MKLFGRPLLQYLKGILQAPRYLRWAVKCCFLFENPIRVIRCYVTRSGPDERVLKLRSGLRIALSDHPHDVVTVFLIFVREDYGRIQPGSTVVDVGANIGVFALHAAWSGAKKVYAYEPNKAAYEHLARNISMNNLENVIVPRRAAVHASGGLKVRFPVQSSPYGSILTGRTNEQCEVVETVTLADIVGDGVDLLKMDCEGAEYGILFASGREVLGKIEAIRMEYHKGYEDILSFAGEQGFRLGLLGANSRRSGKMWLQKALRVVRAA